MSTPSSGRLLMVGGDGTRGVDLGCWDAVVGRWEFSFDAVGTVAKVCALADGRFAWGDGEDRGFLGDAGDPQRVAFPCTRLAGNRADLIGVSTPESALVMGAVTGDCVWTYEGTTDTDIDNRQRGRAAMMVCPTPDGASVVLAGRTREGFYLQGLSGGEPELLSPHPPSIRTNDLTVGRDVVAATLQGRTSTTFEGRLVVSGLKDGQSAMNDPINALVGIRISDNGRYLVGTGSPGHVVGVDLRERTHDVLPVGGRPTDSCVLDEELVVIGEGLADSFSVGVLAL